MLLEFPDGIILFEGDIGSGKSTILMAIEFALFGLGDQKPQSLLRVGCKIGEVKFKFSIKSEIYEIGRKIEAKGKKFLQQGCYLTNNSSRKSLSVSELKQQILSILHYNEKKSAKAKSVIYRYAIFTPQEEMKQILSIKPNDRLQTLRKVFQIEDYVQAEFHGKNLLSELKAKKKMHDSKIRELNFKNKAIYEEIESHSKKEEELKQATSNRKEITDDKEILKKNKDKLIADKIKLSKIEGQIDKIKKYSEDHKEMVEKLKKEIKKNLKIIVGNTESLENLKNEIFKLKQEKSPKYIDIKNIQGDLDRISPIELEIKNKFSQLQIYEDQIIDSKNAVAEFENHSLKQFDAEIKNFETKLSEIENKITIINKESEINIENISSFKVKINDLNDINQNLINVKPLKGICPTCGQNLSEEERKGLLHKNNKELDKLKEKYNFQDKEKEKIKKKQKEWKIKQKKGQNQLQKMNLIQKELNILSNSRKNYKKIMSDISKLKIEIDLCDLYKEWSPDISPEIYLRNLLELANNYDKHRKQLNNFLDQEKDKQEYINSLQDLNIKDQNEIDRISKIITNLKDELEEKQVKYKEMNNLTKLLIGLQKELQIKNEELEAIQRTIGKLGESISNSEMQIKLNQETRIEIKKDLQEIEIAMDYYIWIDEFFLPTLPKIESLVMNMINDKFNDKFRNWFSMLVHDPTKDARIDECFTPIIEQDGYEQSVNYLSGGEKTSIALAYRLALNSTIQAIANIVQANVLIFDEPTDGFSKTQLFKFRDILQELKAKQIILVSHEQELEGFADHIFQVKKFEGISSIQRI